MGESFGAWHMGDDAGVMPLVSSANIACGFHAGDASVMRRTVALALAHGVALGAHVSLPDLQGFGRREMHVAPGELRDLVQYQLGALAAIAAAQGAKLSHVKPHGALYNMAARDRALADAIAVAVREVDATLALFGLAGSALVAAVQAAGLVAVAEGFADRSYEPDGMLTPRNVAGAVHLDRAVAAAQAVALARGDGVRARNGAAVPLAVDTICIHGDGADPVGFAHALREHLARAGIEVRAPRR
ncbi:MAG TPA: 5-oxoprolinase subunit PxpA [Candidatus Saccharimonadia bacterium]|nr:5-oxoprolinase subunit PxpA [Candidatus Saccharimonadia bacterium]